MNAFVRFVLVAICGLCGLFGLLLSACGGMGVMAAIGNSRYYDWQAALLCTFLVALGVAIVVASFAAIHRLRRRDLGQR